MVMAEAFPESTFVGFDFHEASIERANELTRDAGLPNIRFAVSSAKDYPGHDYDLVAFFDCLHDMGDPVGALRHVRETLAPDGTVMLVEPQAGDRVEDNLNPVGRVYYCASTMLCTPASSVRIRSLPASGGQCGKSGRERERRFGIA